MISSRRVCLGLLPALVACATPPPTVKRQSAEAPRVTRADAGAPAPEPPVCSLAGDRERPVPLPELEDSSGISQRNLQRWVYTLAGPELRGRPAGSDDARRSARLIASHFSAVGAEAPTAGGFCTPFSREDLDDQNVVAHLRAASPCKWVVVGAHYDALGADERGRVRPGADDDASGMAVVLELARIFAKPERRPRVNLVLAAFGAEEKGLWGSRAYVKAPSVPLERVALMINVDMAGRRLQGNPGLGYEASGPETRQSADLVKSAAKRAKVPVIAMRLGDRGDSASFSPHVPTVFFSTTVHADYHQPTDTPERVDYGQVERAAAVVLALVESSSCEGF